MQYAYTCPQCNHETIITKPMSDSNFPEYCTVCSNELKRVYESPSIKTTDGVKK